MPCNLAQDVTNMLKRQAAPEGLRELQLLLYLAGCRLLLCSCMVHAQATTNAEVAEEVCSILHATRERGLQAAGHSGMSAGEAGRIGSSFGDAKSKRFSGKVGHQRP